MAGGSNRNRPFGADQSFADDRFWGRLAVKGTKPAEAKPDNIEGLSTQKRGMCEWHDACFGSNFGTKIPIAFAVEILRINS
jgi:hypothetical protein